ncbi:GntR family transcriptional regulator [Glaciibacter superstes]|uniref:GntR family transcriptional regulator n=1 Tax=Glaciibacter superstes TaxID=501023 RepID=UPI000A033EB5|nr:GntR family transcriptional regulator [Glaciibacter superstes]
MLSRRDASADRDDDRALPARASKATAAEGGYRRLHGDIVQGRVMPNERLVELDLTESLGVPRAAVRIILARLENDGLVVREPNRGARVRMVSESEAFEITRIRAAIESLAAEGAALHATDDDIAEMRAMLVQMRELMESGDLLKYSDVNSLLHAKVTATSGNQTAARLIAELKAQLVRFQYRTVLVVGRAKNSFAEHTEIVEAIAAHDPERAAAAMRTHLSHVAETLRDTAGARSQRAHGEPAP